MDAASAHVGGAARGRRQAGACFAISSSASMLSRRMDDGWEGRQNNNEPAPVGRLSLTRSRWKKGRRGPGVAVGDWRRTGEKRRQPMQASVCLRDDAKPNPHHQAHARCQMPKRRTTWKGMRCPCLRRASIGIAIASHRRVSFACLPRVASFANRHRRQNSMCGRIEKFEQSRSRCRCR